MPFFSPFSAQSVGQLGEEALRVLECISITLYSHGGNVLPFFFVVSPAVWMLSCTVQYTVERKVHYMKCKYTSRLFEWHGVTQDVLLFSQTQSSLVGINIVPQCYSLLFLCFRCRSHMLLTYVLLSHLISLTTSDTKTSHKGTWMWRQCNTVFLEEFFPGGDLPRMIEDSFWGETSSKMHGWKLCDGEDKGIRETQKCGKKGNSAAKQ